MKIDGKCHCGNISFVAELDPGQVIICHCTDCQALSGASYRVVVRVPKDKIEWHGGKAKTYVKTAESGTKRVQAFCPECGTPIYSAALTDTPAYYLRVGSIRQRAELPPKAQGWCRSALGWVMDLRDVTKAS